MPLHPNPGLTELSCKCGAGWLPKAFASKRLSAGPSLSQTGMLSPIRTEAGRQLYSSRTIPEQIISDQFASTLFNIWTNHTVHSW